MSRLGESLSALARHELAKRSFCELAVVTSSFPGSDENDGQTVSIQLKDSGLAIPRVPVAVGLTGLGALPREGDVVVVLFPRGELASPIVVAQVYSDQRRPPTFERDEVKLVWPGEVDDPEAKAVQVSIKVVDGERTMSVTLGGDKDASVTVTEGKLTLVAGGVKFELSHSSDTDGRVELSAGGTKVVLEQDGDLSLETSGTLKLKGAEVTIEGDTSVKVNGQTVEIN
jgi:phage baseplate assembly protein gpV